MCGGWMDGWTDGRVSMRISLPQAAWPPSLRVLPLGGFHPSSWFGRKKDKKKSRKKIEAEHALLSFAQRRLSVRGCKSYLYHPPVCILRSSVRRIVLTVCRSRPARVTPRASVDCHPANAMSRRQHPQRLCISQTNDLVSPFSQPHLPPR